MPVPIPPRLTERPQWRGLPIPYITLVGANGEPDFRVTDEMARRESIRGRLCQLCGTRLGGNLFFVGGPKSADALAYFEPAAHLECVIYAMQVCPFIAGRRDHADMTLVRAAHAGTGVEILDDDSYETVKCPFWVILKAKSYTGRTSRGGTFLLHPENVLHRTIPLHAESMGPADWAAVEKALRG